MTDVIYCKGGGLDGYSGYGWKLRLQVDTPQLRLPVEYTFSDLSSAFACHRELRGKLNDPAYVLDGINDGYLSFKPVHYKPENLHPGIADWN